MRLVRAELARLERERAAEAERVRAKESEIEEPRKLMEDISLCNERLRVSTLKECSRTRRIRELKERRGVAALECVLAVRLRSQPHDLYAFRRQFGALVPTLARRLADIEEFGLWYATDNAVQDFKAGESAALDAVGGRSRGVRLSTTANAIRVDADAEGADEPAQVALRVRAEVENVLRAMGLVRLNVEVLRALFRDNRPDLLEAFAADAATRMKGDIYAWLRDAYVSESNKKRRTRRL